MKVEKVVFRMLTEGTGEHMLDSGGAYGRHWQRNAKKTIEDFRKEPSVSYDEDANYTISLFHYLTRSLELNGICDTFNRKFNKMKDWESDIYGVSTQAKEWIKNCGFEVGRSFNSYNGESSLSQVIQGNWLTLGDKNYLLLQIHQGCDVRGGYTDAKLFYVPDFDEGALIEDVYGSIEKVNGTVIEISNTYNGYSLTDNDGKEIEVKEGDKISLALSEY